MNTFPLKVETRLNARGFHIHPTHRDKFITSLQEQAEAGWIVGIDVPFYYRSAENDVIVFKVSFNGKLKVMIPRVSDPMFDVPLVGSELIMLGVTDKAYVTSKGVGVVEILTSRQPCKFGDDEILTSEKFSELLDNIAAIGWTLERFITPRHKWKGEQ